MVENWFRNNTFSNEEFKNIKELVSIKKKNELKISLGIPVFNEEETIYNILKISKKYLMEDYQLLDEIFVIDSQSNDNSVEIAKNLNIPVYNHKQILSSYGSFNGKGEAIWKSLFVMKGDILIWIDADIINFHQKFIYGTLGPLLKYPNILYSKGYYKRPLVYDELLIEDSGGRVTELAVRPLINLFLPELSGIVQPLSGEYAVRRHVVERVPIFTDYALEIGLLIDIFNKYGLSTIAQVDLDKRIHKSQELRQLSKMSLSVIRAIYMQLIKMKRIAINQDIRSEIRMFEYNQNKIITNIEQISQKQRPPIITIPEYVSNKKTRH